ncbi:MAG TPA: sigma-70 family RNA polymerase sigma factor [Vicinamibacterales bacterium]|nr:sigma-70 family RNA polymerase sigma factor [Vicinamibacterales bacterium]
MTAIAADLLTALPPADASAEGRESAEIRTLIDAARAGDREAFGGLVVLNERVVLRTALAALGSREDAEDVTQEAFLVAWQRLPGFRGESTFRTWLLTITWRKALDRRRARRRWWTRLASGSADEGFSLDVLPEPGADPERAAVARDLSARVGAAINGLSPRLRDTLLLATSGEFSYEQISQMLSTPVGTIKWRVAEARRIVKLGLPE